MPRKSRTLVPLFFAIGFSLGWIATLSAQNAQSDNEEAGVFNTFQNRLPVILWPSDDVPDAIGVLEHTQPSSYASINTLRNKVALSASRPKLSTSDSEVLLSARLRLLYTNGALDGAEALLSLVNWNPPIVRAEVEKVVLLTSRPDKYCGMLTANRFSEIDHGMKVYCLIRESNYPAAKELFESKQKNWPKSRQETLRRFLDIDEINPILDTPWEDLPAPLDFVLDESFGRPRGNIPLPPAYAYFAREMGTSPQQQLEYTEDLTRTGALPANVLFAAYRTLYPKKDSDVERRARLIRALTTKTIDPNSQEFYDLINELYYEFSSARLLDPIASQFVTFLGKIDLITLTNPSTRNMILRLGFIGGWSKPEWKDLIPIDDYMLIQAFKIRHPEINFDGYTNLHMPTFASQKFANVDFNYIRAANASQPTGLQILDALTILENYRTASEPSVNQAFQTLFDSGQFGEAQDIAISILYGGIAP